MIAQLPAHPGVYVVRAPRQLGRAEGFSDIVYIGKGVGFGGVQGRVSQYFVQESTTTTTGRVYQWLEWYDDLETGFVIGRPKLDPNATERQLLERYEEDHHELPPINRGMAPG